MSADKGGAGGTCWYTPEGAPHYDATLREARKFGLFPGASSISKVVAKPSLEAWKISSAIAYCYSMTHSPIERQQDEETRKMFLGRVVDSYKGEVTEAAQRGSDIHDALSHYIIHGEIDPDIPPNAAVNSAYEWIEKHLAVMGGQSEIAITNASEGYGGRVDYYGPYKDTTAIVDFKSRKVKKGKPSFYQEDAMQLAAYAEAIRLTHRLKEAPPIVSLIISTSDDDHGVYSKLWSEEEQDTALTLFRLCLAIWRITSKFPYTPPSGANRVAACDHCHQVVVVPKMTRLDRAFFCRHCQSLKVTQNRAQNKYRTKRRAKQN